MFVRCARQYLNPDSRDCCEHKAQNTHKNKRLIPLAVYYTEEDGKFYLVAKEDGSEYMIGPVTNQAANMPEKVKAAPRYALFSHMCVGCTTFAVGGAALIGLNVSALAVSLGLNAVSAAVSGAVGGGLIGNAVAVAA